LRKSNQVVTSVRSISGTFDVVPTYFRLGRISESKSQYVTKTITENNNRKLNSSVLDAVYSNTNVVVQI